MPWHHPLVMAGVAYWSFLSTITVKLDLSSLLVGLLPTVAVVVQYWLNRRAQRQIAETARVASEAAAEKVAEVHTIVNQQRTDMIADKAALTNELLQANARITDLTDRLAKASS